MTSEKGQWLLDALREKPSFAAACRKVRISRQTFYRWRHEDPAFDAAVLKAREEGLDALEDALVTRGARNDTTAAIFMLKSLRRSVYGDKIEHGGTIKHAHHDMAAFTDEEIDALAVIAERRKGDAL